MHVSLTVIVSHYRKFSICSYLNSFMNIAIVQKMNLQYKKLKKYYIVTCVALLDVCT